MTKHRKNPFFLTILFSLLPLSIAADTITPTHFLTISETLVSSGGTFALGFFTPTNSGNRYIGIWYHKIPDDSIVWVANRHHPTTDATAILTITANGTLVAIDQNSSILWSSTTTSPLRSPVAQLLDTDNFAVKEANSSNNSETFAWQRFDYPADTLLPGMKLGWNLISALNRNLTSWTSPTDPSPGLYTLAIDNRGDPQLTLWVGSVRQWRSGPWIDMQFSSDPHTPSPDSNSDFNFPSNTTLFTLDFVNKKEEIYYTVGVLNKSTITHLVLNQFGIAQRFVWLDGSGKWGLHWYTPNSQCDGFDPCGPYGLCYWNGDSTCQCLPGFEPKLPADWDSRDFSGGCVRKKALDCRNGTDEFAMMQQVPVLDTEHDGEQEHHEH